MLALLFVLPLAGNAVATGPPQSPDTARELNRNRDYAHDSSGQIIHGPSRVDEIVVGQPDRAGNIHVDPLTHGQPVRPPPVEVPPPPKR